MSRPRRRIIVHVAVSADGHIARSDGAVDWLDRPHPKGRYGLVAFFETIDTILWGRKTYDKSLEMTGGKFDGFGKRSYVFTHRPPKTAPPGVEFVSEEPHAFAKRLRAQRGKDIFMMGGGELIASFLDAGEIDEFNIAVIPVFIGEGIPLIGPGRRTLELKLLSSRRYPDGVVMLRYERSSLKRKRA